MEPARKAFAGGLQAGFFACPGGEESLRALIIGERCQNLFFFWCEIIFDQSIKIAHKARKFEINADGYVRDSNQRFAAGMGDVEMRRIGHVQKWLALGRSGECQLVGCAADIF